MQIDFKTQDQEPKAHRFVIHRDSTGSYELVDKLNPDDLVEERVSTVLRRGEGGGGDHIF